MDLSPFPTGFLTTELFYSGAWQSITADTDQSGVSISHGARSEGGSGEVSSLSFSVRNGDGKYSPRNPTSPLYGLVGRNTPARARVGLGAAWLDLETSGARATTPDAAALSITGDIDIRWWGYRDSWRVAADLMSKYSTTSNQRSWLLRAESNGELTLFWSADGTTLVPEARSTMWIPAWAGEIALRVTLDVNNGAGGHTVRFYYSDSLTGTWVQLGDDYVGTGTTSIFDSTAAFTLGKEPTSSAGSPPQRVYGWQMRNGIGGTVVMSRTVSDLAAGAALTDTQGRAYTITSGAVTNTHTIAVCEVAEWPVDWNTKGAPSVMTEVQASGVTRRLGQGQQPLDSAVYRSIMGLDQSAILGYWPMEDGTDATTFGPAIGTNTTTWSGAPTLATYEGFGGSKPLPELNNRAVRGRVPRRASTGALQVRHLVHMPPAGVSGEFRLLDINFHGSGGADLGTAQVWANQDGAIRLRALNSDGTDVGGSNWIAFVANGKNLRLSVSLENNGSDIDYVVATVDAQADELQLSGTITGRNLDPVSDVLVNPDRFDTGATAFGHLTIENGDNSLFAITPDVLSGYTDESSAQRMSRLAAENGVAFTRRHNVIANPMGPQGTDTFLDLMKQATDADSGLLHDDPRALGLRYRSLHSMGSQPAVVIPYTDNLVIPFKPSDDDALTRNRVTVSRPNGSRYTAEALAGPMSTQAPPNGVGLYDEAQELNLGTDDLVRRSADWLVHVGTWDEARYPTLGVDLAHPYFLANPVLTRELLALTPGDRIVITDPPSWLPPRSVDVLVMGVQIDVTPLHLRLVWTCIPARPYRLAYWNAGHRWSGSGTVLTSGVTSTATSLSLTVPAHLSWTHADGDYDITIGGEVMTVTNVVGTTMTVTRSVNGVVKTHAAGAAVALADPSFYVR